MIEKIFMWIGWMDWIPDEVAKFGSVISLILSLICFASSTYASYRLNSKSMKLCAPLFALAIGLFWVGLFGAFEKGLVYMIFAYLASLLLATIVVLYSA